MWRCESGGNSDLGVNAAVGQFQVGAVLVADGTHGDVRSLADFFTGKKKNSRIKNQTDLDFSRTVVFST